MSEGSFNLLGHDNPWGQYPAPVVPVGRDEKGLLAVVYAATDSHQVVVHVADEAKFVKDELINAKLEGFDHQSHRLFAFDKDSLIYYPIEDEKNFFRKVLKDSRLKGENPFLRLSFAKETRKKSLITREVVACLNRLSKPRGDKKPVFINYWYENERLTFANDKRFGFQLPEQWQELVARESAPLILRILSKLNVPEIIIPASASFLLVATVAFLLSIRTTFLTTSLGQMLQSMSAVVLIVLAALGVMLGYSAAIIVERLRAYRAARKESDEFLERLSLALEDNDFLKALEISAEYPRSHLAVIVKSAFAELKSSGFSDVSNYEMEAAKQAAARARTRKTSELKRGLSTLARVGSVAPIVGLLGTIVALINSFGELSQGQVGIETAARIISEALIATGVGVLVAVPAFLASRYFERRVANLVSEMNQATKKIEERFGQDQTANYGRKQLALE